MKWFDRKSGYGFVIPENQSGDVFLHATTLHRAGITALVEKACFLCRIEQGARGWMVTDILELLDEGREPTALDAEPPCPAIRAEDTVRLKGVVKFFTPEKGFGFVTADDGEDVFLHLRCVKRHGLTTIEPGQRIAMTVVSTPRCREVVEFELLNAPDSEAEA